MSSTSTFKPIGALTIQLHLTSSYSVFVNYQITVDASAEFWTKLQVGHTDNGLMNAGSLVHYELLHNFVSIHHKILVCIQDTHKM